MSISVKYIYSACIVIATPDVRILCDPWFTEGVYDGSWYHFPEVSNPLEAIGDIDIVYVSHIHPDHYDAEFLKSYFARYGEKEILIADHDPNHLFYKMRADGLGCTVLSEPRRIGSTLVDILPHRTGSISDIDSALIVKHEGERRCCVANSNDVIFDDDMIDAFVERAGKVDILCCGYTGAGPFPQTYFDLDDPKLPEAANQKKEQFFERYLKLVDAVGAKKNVPFAGKYILGGRLAPLNEFRGVADPVEVLELDPNAVVLADNGGTLDTISFEPTAVRTEPYSREDITKRISEISTRSMDYERLINAEEIEQLPIRRLLALAAKRAFARSECNADYFYVIPVDEKQAAILNINKNNPSLSYIDLNVEFPQPYSLLKIDPRYLFGLLTNIYHWNNAEVGSQFETRRQPNIFNRDAQRFLNYLSIG
ncbi:MBL fold metallo-hydrolase [Erythrobacter rubeus]|uniref:MBL fold metallo-hydrolase n=1 Tax=Erythrobacter rubeus TaxID=2760803 RepID=A0ABR8KSA8_9SPHN|nr:MBL fold metallo-hydrolase [Erythrobacter rubeus]MBD2842460.1 MBL fold metallo-hydrolase [Erythrobacter rubeus]